MRLCSPHCGLAPESGSGGEVYEREVLKGLARLGVESDILLARGKRYPEGIDHWTIHPVRPAKGLRWWVTPFVWPRAIKRCWDRQPFDLLRAHSVRFAGPAALIARRRYRLPVPVVTHHHHLDPSPLNRLIERRVIEASDLVVTDSEFAKRQLVDELRVRTDHVRVVYCGVGPEMVKMGGRVPGETSEDSAARWRYDVVRRRLIVSIGPLIARKRPDFLLRAFAEVHREEPKAALVWIGKGPLLGAMKRLARRLGVETAVRFPGYVPERDKLVLLRSAEVFAFPSILEGFPLAPLEAMACGVPIVACRAASMAEMIQHGETGFLVGVDQRITFAEAILTLLRGADLRWRMGRAAAERVAGHFRWEHTARGVLRAYHEALGDAR